MSERAPVFDPPAVVASGRIRGIPGDAVHRTGSGSPRSTHGAASSEEGGSPSGYPLRLDAVERGAIWPFLPTPVTLLIAHNTAGRCGRRPERGERPGSRSGVNRRRVR
jgi:hypothetical protein